jgi:hypothetical protein
MTDLETLIQLLNYTMPDRDTRSIAINLLDKYGSLGNVLISKDDLLDNDTKILMSMIKTVAKKMIWENLDGLDV